MEKQLSATKVLNKQFKYLASVILLFAFSTNAMGEVIDPEKYIKNNGYQSQKIGDDGKTVFYSFTERANSERIKTLETEIEKLPKNPEVFEVCDFMRGAAKAKLIEQMGIALDVAVINYGYHESTIACVLKYMHGNKVGTQLIYTKKGSSGMYMVFVTD